MDTSERLIRAETVRVPHTREPGSCLALSQNIDDIGLQRPITLWAGGDYNNTLISGRRRLTAYMLLQRDRIPAVYVRTVEDAAKRLIIDMDEATLATPWKWSEICRLWELLRRLDAPAQRKRLEEARRRGVELRRKTQSGQRKPGRSHARSDDYVLSVISEPFGISSATARRIEVIFEAAHAPVVVGTADESKRALALEIMQAIDDGGSIWANYQRFMGQRGPVVPRAAYPVTAAPVAAVEPAPPAKQLAGWQRTLPTLEGLVAGLADLGAPNPELTWDQVGPVHTRLMAVRRQLEQVIKKMRESNQS